MDYAFYLKRVATLTPELRESALAWALQYPENVNSVFAPGRHPGQSSSSIRLGPQNPVELGALIRHLDPLMPQSQAVFAVINRLKPGGFVREHTDSTGSATSTGWITVQQHMVHCALQTGTTLYGFRRDQRLPLEEQEMMEGNCYLFNNYATHAVRNIGEIERVNVVIYYSDPKWELKRRLYRELDVMSATY